MVVNGRPPKRSKQQRVTADLRDFFRRLGARRAVPVQHMGVPRAERSALLATVGKRPAPAYLARGVQDRRRRRWSGAEGRGKAAAGDGGPLCGGVGCATIEVDILPSMSRGLME